jgi:YidC/Oxa1 family membrane protein insertase
MEKRTVVALVLTMAVIFAWQFFFTPQQQAPTKGAPAQAQQQVPQTQTPTQAPAPAAGQTATPPVPAGATAPASAPVTPVVLKSTKQIIVDTPKMTVTFGDLGGGITSVKLKEYKEKVGKPEGKEIIEHLTPYQYLAALSGTSNGQTYNDVTLFSSDKENLTVTDTPQTITFTGALTNGKKVKKVYAFSPDSYTVGLTIEAEGMDQTPLMADFAVMALKNKSSYVFSGPFVYDGSSFDQISKLEEPVNKHKSYKYTGFDLGYFSFLFVPKEANKPDLLIAKSGDTPIDRFALSGGRLESELYFVPNKYSFLKQLGINAEKIVNFGWFDILAKPMLWGMNYSNKLTGNYGIDIILLTILIKIIFYPLSVKSYKSMKQMQKMQPAIAKLKEKYKDDKEKLNKEMMEMYKGKVNPLGGCLPMVVQIPVFFALYRVLMGAIEFRHAPFMLWMNDLAAPEDLFTLHVAGYALPFRVLPLIMGVSMLVQQKMTPTSVDPMQEKMMLLMPIVFTFMFWGFPTGLVLYWLVNNIVSIGQQYYINKRVA